LLHPAAGWGSPCFHAGPPLAALPVRRPVRSPVVGPTLPRDAPHTPRRSPPTCSSPRRSCRSRLEQPHHCDRLPPRRCASEPRTVRRLRGIRRPPTSRPCSAGGSVATATVASRSRPLLPWALRPSRVLARPLDPPTRCVSASARCPSSRRPRTTSLPPSTARSAGSADAWSFSRSPRSWPSFRLAHPVAREDVRFEDTPVRSVCSPSAPSPPRWVDRGPQLRTLLGFFDVKELG
jgi:hypothetical protein